MADAPQYTVGQLQKFEAFMQKAAIAAMHEMAAQYNVDASMLDLKWDSRLGVDQMEYKIDPLTKRGVITFGMPAVDRNFKFTLHHAIQFLGTSASKHTVDLSGIQTFPARNAKVVERYAAQHEGRALIKAQEIETHVFTSVLVVHKTTGQSVMVSGEKVSAFDLQTEAHMLLSKKVLGDA